MQDIDRLVLDLITRVSLGADPVQVRAVLFAGLGLIAVKLGWTLVRWGGGHGYTAARAGVKWLRTPREMSRECAALLAALERATFHPGVAAADRDAPTCKFLVDQLKAGVLSVSVVRTTGQHLYDLDGIDPAQHLCRREQKIVHAAVERLMAQHRAEIQQLERSEMLDVLAGISGKGVMPVPSGSVVAHCRMSD